MNAENGKHEFNFFLDKQIQQRLFEAGDNIAAKETLATQIPSTTIKSKTNVAPGLSNTSLNANQSGYQYIKSNSNVGVHKLKDFQTTSICGWCANPNIVYRKSESDAAQKSRGSVAGGNRDSLLSRDSRNRSEQIPEYVFRHYADPRRYIEQYRREHICYDTANSSATKSEFLDSRRFYAFNQYSPLAVNLQNGSYQQTASLPHAQQEAFNQNNDQQNLPQQKSQQPSSTQYTSKREQQKQTISANLRHNNQHQYKLSKTPIHKLDSTQSLAPLSETPDDMKDIKRADSAKEQSTPALNGISLHKQLATKVNVPYSISTGGVSARGSKPLLASSSSDANIGNHFHGHKLTQRNGSGGQTRTLDTLTCVTSGATDKQNSGVQAIIQWEIQERLEQLRKVNQCPAKPKTTRLHLSYVCAENSSPATITTVCVKSDGQLEAQSPRGKRTSTTNTNNDNNKNNRKNRRGVETTSTINNKNKNNNDNNNSNKDGQQCSTINNSINIHDRNSSNVNNSIRSANKHITTSNSSIESCWINDNVDIEYVNPDSMDSPHDESQHIQISEYDRSGNRPDERLPCKKNQTLLAISQDVSKSSALSKPPGATMRGGQEERSSLSHMRRIKHLIEQSRLRSKFGQLLGKIAEPPVSLSGSEGGESSENDSISKVSINVKAKPSSNGSTRVDRTARKKAKHFLCNVEDSREVGVPPQSTVYCSKINLSPSLLPKGFEEEMDGKTPNKESYIPTRVKAMTSEASREYMDALTKQVSAAVKVSVPKLKYSKIGGVARSQTMHF